MPSIFMSYRREDAEGEAGRLFDDLVSAFGEHSVFMDVAAIEVGRDFRKAIEESVASCSVLLAIIGKSWVDAKDEAAERRLDNPYDFVRLETASALKRNIPVIPVLVHGAKMPRVEQLPDDLKELAYRNGVELTHARWGSDIQLLVKALRPHVEERKLASAAPIEALAQGAAGKMAPAPAEVRAPAPVVSGVPEPGVEAAATPAKKPLGIIVGALVAVLVVGAVVAYMMMPKQVAVPDLIGATLADATAKLKALKLTVGQTTSKEDATKDPNTVVSQSPAPSANVKIGASVDLVVSQQPQLPQMVEVPLLVGKSLDASRQALEDRGLAVGRIDREAASDKPPNTVLNEFPSPGAKVKGGSKIDLLVNEVREKPAVDKSVAARTAEKAVADRAAAEKNGCGQYFRAGATYKDLQKGGRLTFSGQITIDRTFRCTEGTCFSARMSFDNYGGGVNTASGYWSGSRFQLKRLVTADKATQVWSGSCTPNSLQGSWSMEGEPSNLGDFWIYY